ncbi:MAG: adenylyltransferase/cytidyltransferase family protein [Candidatus Doudnabacteria bacterium]|nr:adenylyltransferase/cytidyltransferase family protein [Candidatus Doudnabacteria bacterium]
MIKILISGGFDPIHIGHIKLLKAAKGLGDYLIVLANNDNWLKKKKGFVFMNQDERKAVLEAIRWVDEVLITKHPQDPKDMSVCAELREIKPDIFANGGDRDKKDADTKSSSLNPEQALCGELGIKMLFNVGGEKIQSSSELVKNLKLNH